jgi:hypothetical protein
MRKEWREERAKAELWKLVHERHWAGSGRKKRGGQRDEQNPSDRSSIKGGSNGEQMRRCTVTSNLISRSPEIEP